MSRKTMQQKIINGITMDASVKDFINVLVIHQLLLSASTKYFVLLSTLYSQCIINLFYSCLFLDRKQSLMFAQHIASAVRQL